MATKITFGNFKGGVGKTTASSICSFILQEKKYKVLFVDLDPQADSTELLTLTFGVKLKVNYMSIYEAILAKNLNRAIVPLSDYLDILPSGEDLVGFKDELIAVSKNKVQGAEHFYLDYLLQQIEDKYDFVLFDVPPTISEFTYNALASSDYVLPVLQTQISAFKQTKKYLEFIEEMQEIMVRFEYPPVQVLGVIPYLQKSKGQVDKHVVEQAEEQMGDLLLNSRILERERIKRYSKTGIQRADFHDKKALRMYESVVGEILERVGK
jgi:cellulose biosynthesis protein BcsQ